MALTLKYRPSKFKEVVGQEAVSLALANAVKSGRLHPAYLFYGPRGCGKTSMARIFARAVNCLDSKNLMESGEPCGRCGPCGEISAGHDVDVQEIDAASHTKVEEVREVIIETLLLVPARDRRRIFIIDEAHMLSGSSFNALLKTLEEPPPHILFILATTEFHKVPATVVSRTQSFAFRAFSLGEITERLRAIIQIEKLRISDDALLAVARQGGGSLRDAIGIMEQAVNLTDPGDEIQMDHLVRLLGLIEDRALTELLNGLLREPNLERVRRALEDQLYIKGHSPAQLLKGLLERATDELTSLLKSDCPRAEARRCYLLVEHVIKVQSMLRSAWDPALVCQAGILGWLAIEGAGGADPATPSRAFGESSISGVAQSVNPGPQIPESQGVLAKTEAEGTFDDFIAGMREIKLGFYIERARFVFGEAGQPHVVILDNNFQRIGIEKNKDKVLSVWKKIFPHRFVQFELRPSGQVASAGHPKESPEYVAGRADAAAATVKPRQESGEGSGQADPDAISEDLRKLAKAFGGQVKRIRK